MWNSLALVTGMYVGYPMGHFFLGNPNYSQTRNFSAGIIGSCIGAGLLTLISGCGILPIQTFTLGTLLILIPLSTGINYELLMGTLNLNSGVGAIGALMEYSFYSGCIGFVLGVVVNVCQQSANIYHIYWKNQNPKI